MFLLHVLVRLGHHQIEHAKYEIENYLSFTLKLLRSGGSVVSMMTSLWAGQPWV